MLLMVRQMAMKRILILGCCGSGKTSFARQLHAATQIPLIHLDREYLASELDRTTSGGMESNCRRFSPTGDMDNGWQLFQQHPHASSPGRYDYLIGQINSDLLLASL